jgi:hypothetical protein
MINYLIYIHKFIHKVILVKKKIFYLVQDQNIIQKIIKLIQINHLKQLVKFIKKIKFK